MDNFWKPFLTLFGIGAMVSLAKSLKSKKPWSEVFSELIIQGFFATGAGVVYIFYPTVPFLAVAAVAAIGATIGVALVSDELQKVIESRFGVGKKDGSGL